MNLGTFQTKILSAKSKLYRFAFRLLGNEEEAKDIVQEVFIKVWNGRERMQEIENWEAWCMRMTKNLSLDRIRSRNRRSIHSLDNYFNMKSGNLLPDETAELDESMQRINVYITALPEKQRQVIHLRDVEGYSYHEIAEILELDMNQVKVNLFRARNAVREKLIKTNAYGL